VVYVYFDYKDQQNQSYINVLSSLLKQLVLQIERVPSELRDVWISSLSKHQRPAGSSWLLELFTAVSKQFTATYVLVDAFDECHPSQQENILAAVEKLCQENKIRVMLTSRHYLQSLNSLPAITLTISANNTDVKKYLSSKLEKEKFLNQELKEKISLQISSEKSGMYNLQ
jgi:hypothetical protein